MSNPTFTFSGRSFVGDYDLYSSLDDSKKLFLGLPKSNPTLEMALREAKILDHDIILENAREFSLIARDDPEIASLGLTDDEAGAISCYTLQTAGGLKSPYEVINEGLAGSRNRAGLFSTRKLIYLLLSGLRKLPRFKPSTEPKMLYRGIRRKVPTTKEGATITNEGGEVITHQYYVDGGTVTWWGFTSTTTSLSATQNFINGVKESTLFNIGGEDLWGYKIKAFSPFSDEEEVLLEPEAKILVNGRVELGNFLLINVSLQKVDHLVLEDIIPVGNVVGNDVLPQKKSFEASVWKECPSDINEEMKYSVSEENPRIASNVGDGYCTIIGNAHLPLNTVTSWNIKVLKSCNNNGAGIIIGVAPSDIDQNKNDSYNKYGWYFDCWNSSLRSGPPQNCKGKQYGSKRRNGQYVHTGDSVGIVMDTTKGELSFTLGGVNLGVAYEEIPLDKPLVSCVLLWYEDSVELVI